MKRSLLILSLALPGAAVSQVSGTAQHFSAAAGQSIKEGRCIEARAAALQQVESVPGTGAEVARLAGALNDLGTLCHDQGHYQEANWYYRESIALRERLAPAEGLVTSLINLARLRFDEGRWSEAEKMYLRVLGHLDGQGQVDSTEGAAAYSGLAEVSAARGRYAEAGQYARRALSIAGSRPGVLDGQAGVVLFLLGKVLRAQGRLPEAEAFVRQAIASWETSLGRRHRTTESGKACLALMISKTDPVEAEKLLREALEVYEAELGSEHPETEAVLGSLIQFVRGQGRKKEARLLEQRLAPRKGDSAAAAAATHSIDLEALRHHARR